MEKIEFYQRSAVIENYRKFYQTFFQILTMNVIKYFEKIIYLYFMEKIEFYQRTAVIENYDYSCNEFIKYFDLVVCFEKIINF